MKEIYETKEDLYKKVFESLKQYMVDNNISIDDINPKDYVISRRAYFDMRKISIGGKAPFIGKDKMNELLKMLNLKLEIQILYKLSAE